jgi:hypothetical protein
MSIRDEITKIADNANAKEGWTYEAIIQDLVNVAFEGKYSEIIYVGKMDTPKVEQIVDTLVKENFDVDYKGNTIAIAWG